MKIEVGRDLARALSLDDEDDTPTQCWRVCTYNLERVILDAAVFELPGLLPDGWVRLDMTLSSTQRGAALLPTNAWDLSVEDASGADVTLSHVPLWSDSPAGYARAWEGPRSALPGLTVCGLTIHHTPTAGA